MSFSLDKESITWTVNLLKKWQYASAMMSAHNLERSVLSVLDFKATSDKFGSLASFRCLYC